MPVFFDVQHGVAKFFKISAVGGSSLIGIALGGEKGPREFRRRCSTFGAQIGGAQIGRCQPGGLLNFRLFVRQIAGRALPAVPVTRWRLPCTENRDTP